MFIEKPSLRDNAYKISSIILSIVVWITILISPTADAQGLWQGCEASGKNTYKNLGQATSIALNKPRLELVRLPNSGISCSFTLVSWGDRDTIKGTVTSPQFLPGAYGGNQAELRKDGASKGIKYQIFSDPRDGNSLKFNEPIEFADSGLDIFNKEGGNLPLYIRVFPEKGIYTAGTYRSTVNIHWDWNVCKKSYIGVCFSWDQSKGVSDFIVVLEFTVLNDCFITNNISGVLSFGKGPFIESLDQQQQRQIVVKCSDENSNYSIGVSMGKNETGGVRRMRNKRDGTSMIEYNIYSGHGSGSPVWKGFKEPRESPNRVQKSQGIPKGDGARAFNFSAIIEPGQEPKPEGVYEDDIVVDFAF